LPNPIAVCVFRWKTPFDIGIIAGATGQAIGSKAFKHYNSIVVRQVLNRAFPTVYLFIHKPIYYRQFC
jgi:hypothetical protein